VSSGRGYYPDLCAFNIEHYIEDNYMTIGSESGKFKITFEPQGVFLTLDASCFSEKERMMAEITAVLAQKKVSNVDQNAIKKAFAENMTAPTLFAPPQPEPVDGKVRTKLDSDERILYVKIEPPMGHGRKAELKDVMDAVKEAGAGTFYLDLEKIENMLATFRFKDFEPVGEKRDGRFDVTVSKDATEAILKLSPPFGGEAITADDIFGYLQRNNIIFGIKNDIVKDVVNKGIFNENIVIAVGQKSSDGENGGIEYYFETASEKPKPRINEEGEVDFRELNLFQQCKAGDPLARKNPATMGIPGRTVYGEEVLPKPGKDIPVPIGLNTKPDSNDPNVIVASVDGQPKLVNKKISVFPVIDIPADVDFSTGNISFTGTVNIRGNVISGFSVKSTGDINIGACVEACTIECGGNLNIKQGVSGMDKALIICRGNLTTKFIYNATVYCEGDVYVDESIMYSKVSASGKVEMVGKKGFIMGGITRATKTITCNQTGTHTATPTILEVGGSPTMREELDRIEAEIHEAERLSEMQSKSIDSAEKRAQTTPGEMSAEQKQRVLHLSRDRFALLSRLRAFKEKKEDLEEKLINLNSKQFKINVRKTVLPGTKITIKNASWVAHDPLEFSTFREYDGEVQYGPFESEV